MKKYRCTKCGAIFKGKLARCPGCNVELHYHEDDELEAEKQKKKEEQKEVKPEFDFKADDTITKGTQDGMKEETEKNEFDEIKQNGGTVIADGASGFYGSMFKLSRLKFTAFFGSLLSAFLLTPFFVCRVYKYQINNTLISGKRCRFIGTGGKMYGRFLLWCLLTIMTLGLFLPYFGASMEKWKFSQIQLEEKGEGTLGELDAVKKEKKQARKEAKKNKKNSF